MSAAQKRDHQLSIFIPVSILSDVPSLIEKTFKVGQIARAASIFRVERIVVYMASKSDSRGTGSSSGTCSRTPRPHQYLKKRLFPLSTP